MFANFPFSYKCCTLWIFLNFMKTSNLWVPYEFPNVVFLWNSWVPPNCANVLVCVDSMNISIFQVPLICSHTCFFDKSSALQIFRKSTLSRITWRLIFFCCPFSLWRISGNLCRTSPGEDLQFYACSVAILYVDYECGDSQGYTCGSMTTKVGTRRKRPLWAQTEQWGPWLEMCGELYDCLAFPDLRTIFPFLSDVL